MKGEISNRDNGVLVAMEGGTSTAYALNNVQERGKLFHWPARGCLRRDDSRGEFSPGRSECESLQGKASHQHAEPGRRQGRAIGDAPAHDPRAIAGIYRP